ncbi:MAG: glycosyltransferase family 4 protein [Pseudochelatococcus sp.]|jgi:glycosyltransferase involved in cell wall biosynthesis|uniref:glycosyltransferase family 4 protein n=1 Tax=Pseudochelatococcus sp. TaxID=2020869 RepID=UPI003D9309D5
MGDADPDENEGHSPHLVFLVTEDWFFVSHFLPMARAAREMGLRVTVITRVRDHAAAISAIGARVVPMQAERRSLNPLAVAATLRALRRILCRERADILHCVALRSIVLGSLAAPRGTPVVHALTGLGFLGARADAVGRAARAGLRHFLRIVADGPAARFLFENEDDARMLGFDPGDPGKVAIVGGAGVDPAAFPAASPEPSPSLRIAVVARMLWSKGIDLAVEAVGRARAAGADVTLSLYGAPDPSNPRAVPEITLREWGARPGIAWHGATRDVPAVWQAHDVACLPSRGGEGLPRTLLEAGASARAIVTTDVPGCRRLVRDGIEGLVVPPDDAGALADAFIFLANNRDAVSRMGQAARARVEGGYTERHVMETVKSLYGELLGQRT